MQAYFMSLGPGWDSLNERVEYSIDERSRRIAAVKWSSLALCLVGFVLYGFVVG